MKALVSASASLGLILFSVFASAAEVAFNQAQFNAAKAASKPIAVVFHAD